MDKQTKLKRIAIMDKIHELSKRCECTDRDRKKDCANCQELKQLGVELLNLSKPKKKNTLANHDYPLERKGRRLWTEDMIQYIQENSTKFTCKEMAAYLEIEPQQVRSKCILLELPYKREVTIYEFYMSGKMVAKGSIPEIAKAVGIGESTIRGYVKYEDLPHVRKLIKVEG